MIHSPGNMGMDQQKAPLVANLLGAAGLIPFIGTAVGSYYMPEAVHLISDLQSVYGSIILSFMGGIHWGLAMVDTTSIYS